MNLSLMNVNRLHELINNIYNIMVKNNYGHFYNRQ
jgi:hypothetical protein